MLSVLSDRRLWRQTRRTFQFCGILLVIGLSLLIYQINSRFAKPEPENSHTVWVLTEPSGANVLLQTFEMGQIQFGVTQRAVRKFHGVTPRRIDLRENQTTANHTLILQLAGCSEKTLPLLDVQGSVKIHMEPAGLWRLYYLLRDNLAGALGLLLVVSSLYLLGREARAQRGRSLQSRMMQLEGLTVGRILDCYLIERVLGAGGMGQVYLARDVEAQEPVAIKVLHEQYAADPDSRARFLRETNILRQLNHPNIVHLRDWGSVGGRLFLVMDKVEGVPLDEQIGQHPVPWPQAADWCRQVAEGLREARRMGVIHRDIKPANLMLTPAGRVKILDFGIALDRSTRISAAGEIRGTPGYMAPEQLRLMEADWTADLYSLAVMLYTALAGRPPHQAESPIELMRLHLEAPVPPLVEGCAPERLRQAVITWLEKEPGRRGSSWDDVVRTLDEVLAAHPRA